MGNLIQKQGLTITLLNDTGVDIAAGRLVQMDGAGEMKLAGAASLAIGATIALVKAGEVGTVVVNGVVLVAAGTLGSPITVGQAVYADGTGRANNKPAEVGSYYPVGIALTGATAENQILSIKLTSPMEAPAVPTTVQVRLTAAEVDAGEIVIPEVAGYRVALLDWKAVARGGAVTAATGIIIRDTNGTPVVVATIAAAGLTENNVVTPSTATHVANGAGSCGALLTAGKGVRVITNGDPIATATHVDVIFVYQLVEV